MGVGGGGWGGDLGGGHLHVCPDLTVSADLSKVSIFIFELLHSSHNYFYKLETKVEIM